MSFFSKKTNKAPSHNAKITPVGAWGHYSKKQGKGTAAGVTADKETLIEVDKLSLSYEGRAVIENLSFKVDAGDYLCVIGENGSGKSTLMNALLGLKKQSGGNIVFNKLKRNEIGVLPQQEPVERDFPATVREVVMAGCLARHTKGPFLAKSAEQTAFSNMEKLGITPLANRPYRDLSGGQRQRVMIARALCAAEKVLVLDEPVSGLDPKSTVDMYALFRDLNMGGMTVIMVTHDVASAIRYGSHILRINKDSIFYGTIEEYKALPEAQRYIDTPVEEKETPFGEGGFRYADGEENE